MNYFAHPIFDGITEAEWEAMQALHAFRRRRFARGEMILRTGERTRELGLVCAGSVHIESGDAWGGRSILSHVGAGEVFAETYALCGQTLMVDAVAAEDSEIVFAAPAVLLDAARQQEGWYGKLTRNLLRITARKNLKLSERIFCTASKSVRGRLLTYLSAQAARQGCSEFDIPFDRQQLADYLNLDRSALSKELGRMRSEGMLDFRKNHFVLKLVQPPL